jgi:poly-beta-1,6-N-acetyl-D-glucosamine synthase
MPANAPTALPSQPIQDVGGPVGASLRSPSVAEARRSGGPTRSAVPPLGLPYLRVVTRFRVSVICGLAWVGLSTWIGLPWISDLAQSITLPGACLVVLGIALIPGYLNMQLVTSLLMDRPAPVRFDLAFPALTLLVAAFNEQAKIAQTIMYALAQDYPGPLQLTVIDDGSDDETATVAGEFARTDDRVQVLRVPHGGKAEALNAGLAASETPLVATIDADTLLMAQALRRIVARLLIGPPDTVAVAGNVLVRNSREKVVTRIQTWDYFLGIGSIKRQQALLQATLVAQGAFSVYDADALRAAGAWPNCIGEDIVMTWALLDKGGRTTYEPTAVAFTEAPATVRRLARQRRRWARGMIEGLRSYGVALLRRHRTYAHGVLADAVFPYLDFTFTFVFIPGIGLAAFGNFAIVGIMTLAVLPLNALLAGVMFVRQRASLHEAGLKVRRGPVGFILFLLLYQIFMSPVSVSGYVQEAFHARRRW